ATAAVPGAAAVPQAAGAAPVASALPAAPAAAPASQQVTLTTDVVKATFDSQGGTLIRLELLDYPEAVGSTKRVDLFDPQRNYAAQTGLVSSVAGVALPNHLTPMTIESGARVLAPGQDELTLTFRSAPVDGHVLVKTYTLHRGAYTIGVRDEFINQGSTPVSPQLYLQLARDSVPAEGGSRFYSTFTGPAMYTDAGKFRKLAFTDIAKGSAEHDKSADNGWIAMVQHYFVSAWLVNGHLEREFRVAKVADNDYTIAMVFPLGEVAPGASKSFDATLFAGPQEENKLAALAPGFELVKDYGRLKLLSEPLFWLLTRLHALIGNWGWAIVALVVVLKAAFFWLNASAYRSMAKMKAVAPRVAELKERYKDKPQEMQQEMMRIYKEEKVNPIGGCLPIFVQMPFFIALYWVLLSSVEMRGAPWLGWIHDLSAQDPYYILPLVMMSSQLFQTWLNPAPPDPVQAKMMWIMPIAFGFMFFFFPSGLVLYWVTNNILGIAQQWFINKRLGVVGRKK
ncbi:MAG: membrane protein insertase YidC, partial [Burkholderiales bacterium]|nr:membrane protein insertase YidC [Burkholderiales bacterium]